MSAVEKVDIPGCLLDEESFRLLCERYDLIRPLCTAQAPSDSGLTYLAPSPHRLGHRGVEEEAARCDRGQELRRIDPTALEPEIGFGGVGVMQENLRLRAWSDMTWVEWAFRARVQQEPGTGWGYIEVPNIAGFQRPIITLEGTYRAFSTAIQIDTDLPGTAGGTGAGPRGPFMSQEAHHWSSSQRIYMAYFRRDNVFNVFVDFRVKYVCS